MGQICFTPILSVFIVFLLSRDGEESDAITMARGVRSRTVHIVIA